MTDLVIHRLRFHFTAEESIHFPAGKPGNILRGALGLLIRQIACYEDCTKPSECPLQTGCAYADIFEPKNAGGPSGLADPPRPFVFRASHLDGKTVAPKARFHFDLNVFWRRNDLIPYFIAAFKRLATEGLGPGRGKAHLVRVENLHHLGDVMSVLYKEDRMWDAYNPIHMTLKPFEEQTAVDIRFVTPMEIKSGGRLLDRPEFAPLVSRARDRISTLRGLYGDGPLEIDFRAFGEAAGRIVMARCDVQHVSAERTSTRTGQTHSIGGFIGTARYEGDLARFLPFLRCAVFTGIGRQTVWGKGEIRVEPVA